MTFRGKSGQQDVPSGRSANKLPPFFWSKGEIEFWVAAWCPWVAAIAPPHQNNTTTTNNAAEKSLVIIKREQFSKCNSWITSVYTKKDQRNQHRAR